MLGGALGAAGRHLQDYLAASLVAGLALVWLAAPAGRGAATTGMVRAVAQALRSTRIASTTELVVLITPSMSPISSSSASSRIVDSACSTAM